MNQQVLLPAERILDLRESYSTPMPGLGGFDGLGKFERFSSLA